MHKTVYSLFGDKGTYKRSGKGKGKQRKGGATSGTRG